MVFGKINYLNLLPFHLFVKRSPYSSSFKSCLKTRGGPPSKINEDFKFRRIEGGFISSIAAKRKRSRDGCCPVGIVAEKKVMSVILLPGVVEKDRESATSNALADVLGIEGKVLIGDKALQTVLNGEKAYIDMAAAWYDKTGLPFVFGRMCYNNHPTFYRNMCRRFLNSHIKIPQYILEQQNQRLGISKKEIVHYLKHIRYRVDSRERKALKKFYRMLDSKPTKIS